MVSSKSHLTRALTLGALLSPNVATAQTEVVVGVRVGSGIFDALVHPSEYGIEQGEFVDGRCGDLHYSEVSAQLGEQLMCAGRQPIAIMDRPMAQGTICGPNCSGEDRQAAQIRLAVNSISVLRNSGVWASECDNALPVFRGDAFATLRTLYAGPDGSGSPEACASQERRDLVNDWSSFWTNNCEFPGGCQQLHHAFRPDENSGMGQLVGAVAGIRSYCNGGVNDDNDPIRRPCRDDEYFCPKGDLGVVLPVKIPVAPDPATAQAYYAKVNGIDRSCTAGKYAFNFADRTSQARDICPDGEPLFLGFLCLYPQDWEGLFGCLNDKSNGSPLNSTMDGRRYNELFLADSPRVPDDFTPFIRMIGGCSNRTGDSSRQLGCMVGSSHCSVGFGAQVLTEEFVNEDPHNLALVHIDGSRPSPTPDYPLNQFLYLNTIEGFNTATAEQSKLIDCVRNHPKWVQAAVRAARYSALGEIKERPVGCGF